MKNFLSFNKMITPKIIMILFWIGVAFTIMYAFMAFAMGAQMGTPMMYLVGILTLILAPLVVRVYCELLIIMFKIHETLEEIKKEL